MRARSFFTVFAVWGATSLGSQAFARKDRLSDEDQRRALLSQLAAASAEAAPEERTDADLMYEAMKQWRGEPRESAAVDRTLAQSKQDAAHDRQVFEQKLKSMFWKDPFSRELVAVRKGDRDLLAGYADRHATGGAGDDSEVARLRAQVTEARADAAAARAEAAHLRTQLNDRGEVASADSDATAGCAPPPPRHARRHSHPRESFESWNSPAETPSRSRGHHAKPAVSVEAPQAPAEAPPPATQAPAGWQSSDPRGIIVVPINGSSN
ncbi:MAG TPA: hypothetical protein VHG72_06615 [Polyangia bacterium]|nr:hypothetical protein [Polyangia bacterium]